MLLGTTIIGWFTTLSLSLSMESVVHCAYEKLEGFLWLVGAKSLTGSNLVDFSVLLVPFSLIV